MGFLQPINITMQDMSLREKGLYEAEAHLLGAADFSQNADHGKGYINLLRLFEHQDDMYFDVFFIMKIIYSTHADHYMRP